MCNPKGSKSHISSCYVTSIHIYYPFISQPATVTHQELWAQEFCHVTQYREIVLAYQTYEEDSVISVKMASGILTAATVGNPW